VSSVNTAQTEANLTQHTSQEHQKYSADWILITTLLSLGALIIVKQLNSGFLRKLIPAIFNSNKGTALFSEFSKNPSKSLFFLGGISLINTSIFIYQANRVFIKDIMLPPYILIGIIIGILLIARLFHFGISLLSAHTFNILQVHSENRFNIRISNSLFGFILFPIILSISYSPFPETFIYTGIISYIFLQIVRYGRLLRINFKNRINVLYLFLYLCTLEIIPVLLLITAIKKLIIN